MFNILEYLNESWREKSFFACDNEMNNAIMVAIRGNVGPVYTWSINNLVYNLKSLSIIYMMVYSL